MVDSQADGHARLGGGRVALAQYRHRQSARQHYYSHIGWQRTIGQRANLVGLFAVQKAISRDHDRVAGLKRQPRDLQLNILRSAAWPHEPT